MLHRVLLPVLLTVPMYPQATQEVLELAETPVFKASVVARDTKAINYRSRSGATKIDFVGTALMPSARGEAKVEAKRGYIEIEVEFWNLGSPSEFGAEYLTFVLWSISPEGRATNLGELLVNKRRRSKLNVTSELQVFGLIVTAEPYFAVRQPSDLIVMENEIRKGTKGRIFFIDAKTELLQRGQYAALANPLGLTVDLKQAPIDVYQARNAIEISKSLGAPKYASETFGKAEHSLDMASRLLPVKSKWKEVIMNARQATQFAEDARELAIKRQQQEALANERREAAEREAEAKARAAEAEARRQAEEARRKAEEAARAQAEIARQQEERRRMEAELAAARDAAKRAEAEAARAQALFQQEVARREAERAQTLAAEADELRRQAELEKAELRGRLLRQFNMVLETRDTARGLVVNLSDVLFDVGQYTLRPLAREKLARLSGIVLAYPGLNLKTEGHTDTTGSEELNQKLSERRAGAVRDYLVEQGIPTGSVSSVGMGFSMPVADNSTREGRQKNRRVEIIVSGEVIGTSVLDATLGQ